MNFPEEKRIVKKIKKISGDKFIIYHHLGLGDFLVCNGIVNYLSTIYSEIFIPVVSQYYEMIDFMYSENNKVKLFEISTNNRDEQIDKFSIGNSLQILKVGFEEVGKKEFNLAFYKQLKIPYRTSFDYFKLPESTKSKDLMDHLVSYFNVDKNNICLVHNNSHNQDFELEFIKNKQIIYVNKESDIYNNLFLYQDVIQSAKEIHCINSSFVHLVERTNTNAELFFHNVRYSKMHLSKKWNMVEY